VYKSIEFKKMTPIPLHIAVTSIRRHIVRHLCAHYECTLVTKSVS
jgi:hypothetical protein